jgi:hypothetical protein
MLPWGRGPLGTDNGSAGRADRSLAVAASTVATTSPFGPAWNAPDYDDEGEELEVDDSDICGMCGRLRAVEGHTTCRNCGWPDPRGPAVQGVHCVDRHRAMLSSVGTRSVRG